MKPSGGPSSRPLDKTLGRKADPEGGKFYDKRSAWAGARTNQRENPKKARPTIMCLTEVAPIVQQLTQLQLFLSVLFRYTTAHQ